MSTDHDRPLDWGTSDFNAMEAVMWRAEADPTLSSTIVAVEELDSAPEWERFLQTHDWGSRMVPRFRQRVSEPLLGLGYPTWQTVSHFDVHEHVFRTSLRSGTWSELLDRVAAIAQVPFDRSRPPWEATLITGLQGGRAAYVLKMHHAALDGAAGMQLFSKLHSRTSEPTTDKPQPPVPRPTRSGTVQALRRDVAAAAGTVGRLPRLGRRALRPDRSLRDGARYLASLRRTLGPVDATPSPLLGDRSGRWGFVALDVPLGPLRAAAKGHGGSLNDALLAAVLGGFDRYHAAAGQPVAALPVAIPVSVRKPDDPAGGNRFAAARLAGPLDGSGPVERMQAIGSTLRGIRGEPALDAVSGIAPLLARLPATAIARLVGEVTSQSDVQVSNIPGMRGEDLYLAGARVLRFYGFGPLPGCAAMVVLISHGDTCCITVNHDTAAIADADGFADALRDGFDEVLALAPGGHRCEVRR